MSQISYDLYLDRAIAGGRHGSGNNLARNYVNPSFAQVTVNTITAALSVGDWTFTISRGNHFAFSFVYTAAGGDTTTVVATALFRLVAGLDVATGLVSTPTTSSLGVSGIVIPTNPGAGVVDLDFIHSGIVYTVTLTHALAGTATVVNTTAAGGSNRRVGLLYKLGAAANQFDALTTGDLVTDVVGLLEYTRDLEQDPTIPFDFWKPGQVCPIGTRGAWDLEVGGAVDPSVAAFVSLDVGTSGIPDGMFGPSGAGMLDVSSIARFVEVAATATTLAVVELTIA